MDYSRFSNFNTVMQYTQNTVSGCKVACEENIQACERFLSDLENSEYDFNPKDAEFVIKIIENTFCHMQGERLDGSPLRGEPFLLEQEEEVLVRISHYARKRVPNRLGHPYYFIQTIILVLCSSA